MNNHASFSARRKRVWLAGLTAGVTAMLLLVPGVLNSVPLLGQLTGGSAPAACEADATLFPPSETLAQWEARYHDRVAAIVDDHLRQLQTGGACEATVQTKPSASLAALGEDMGGPDVHEEDMAVLLLKYLGKYRCTLMAASFSTETGVATDLASKNAGDPITKNTFNILDFAPTVESQQADIARELDLTERALHRTLVYLAGFSRLQPLSSALSCFAGATQDITNGMSLAAQASTCMPRIWNVRTSLRTLPTP